MAENPEGLPAGIEGPGHLTAGDIAGYLDRELTEARREALDRHLDVCAECRAELAAIARLAQSYADGRAPTQRSRRAVRRWMPVLLGAAAAAGFATILLVRPDFITGARVREPLRTPDLSEGRARLEIVSPSPDSLLPRSRLLFIWRSSSATFYRVTVLNESGASVWTAETRDSTVALPDSVTLLPGATYFWRVEGIANGIAASSGANRLRVKP